MIPKPRRRVVYGQQGEYVEVKTPFGRHKRQLKEPVAFMWSSYDTFLYFLSQGIALAGSRYIGDVRSLGIR